ncbi:hypothetical protein UFOVP377_36 [uncultured Caudovirales phage]|uniref:Uncharacterized protein n=1 Tax=uncultured Caudovirales phage TaxID=2100421 RepID=A0A6J7WYH9_9CAUD|nr:hypothetical protein UFOVP377_36 [uncultured Caudovirales phage]
MRKRSSYRPKPQLPNPVAWIINGFKPISQAGIVNVQIKNHNAIDALRKGIADREDIDCIIEALNIAEALQRIGIGDEYKDELREAQDALYAVSRRGIDREYRFVLKAQELVSINLGMEIHDAQIEVTNIEQMEKAIDIVKSEIKNRRARVILEKTQ